MTAQTVYAVDRRTFAQSYPGDRSQPCLVRADLAPLLAGCPLADDALLIGSELAANAAVHSSSATSGGRFTVRVEVCCGDYVWIEVEDEGGPWTRRRTEDDRPHGLDLVDALAGAGNWGIDDESEHGRIVWVRLDWPQAYPRWRLITIQTPISNQVPEEMSAKAVPLAGTATTADTVSWTRPQSARADFSPPARARHGNRPGR